jgi:hypothetical protein
LIITDHSAIYAHELALSEIMKRQCPS